MKYYQHAGINYQENSARIDVTRASFASLPGELRNLTYEATLKWPSPISIVYNPDTGCFRTPNVQRIKGRTPIEALEVLSTYLDHNIRREARSYFFANNVFQLETTQSFTTAKDYVEIYIEFLEDIGLIGRCSLRWLRLTVSGDCRHHRPTPSRALKLFSLIGECMNLESLDLYAEIDYFYMDQQLMLKLFMSTEGAPISNPYPGVVDTIQRLKSLKRLVLRPVFNGRWRFFDLFVNDRIVTPAATQCVDVKKARFRVRRPIYEATQLSDQIKGTVRKALRGKVRVTVLRTELWEEYGRDILMGRDYELTNTWSLRAVGIIKPPERAFQYSNGVKLN
jgi:hypothetical protein